MGCWKTAKEAIKNGIYNAKQLKNKSIHDQKCSNVLGSRTAMELREVPCIDLETTQTKRKAVLFQDHLKKELKVSRIKRRSCKLLFKCI